MRVSMDSDDPGWIGEENFGRYRVTVDGELIPKAYEADEEAGVCKAYAVNDAGEVYLNPEKTDVVQVEHRGVVRILDTRAAA